MPTRKTTSTKTSSKKTTKQSKSTKKAAPKRASAKTTTKKRAASKKAAPAKRKKSTAPAATAGDKDVTIDRRRTSRRNEEPVTAAEPKLERRKKVNRRRQIDPTTCERDYSEQEVEFMNALDVYKRKSGRMFPTCSEVLEVIRGLGYVQLSSAELATQRGDQPTVGTRANATMSDEAVLEAELVG